MSEKEIKEIYARSIMTRRHIESDPSDITWCTFCHMTLDDGPDQLCACVIISGKLLQELEES